MNPVNTDVFICTYPKCGTTCKFFTKKFCNFKVNTKY